MSRVRDALHWDGTSPRVSLFLASDGDPEIDFESAWTDPPARIERYDLVNDAEPGRAKVVYEYDFDFETLPTDLVPQLEACLRTACRTPDSVAWLAFEGSFHFDHLLTDDIFDQIYGVCAFEESPLVVVDDNAVLSALLQERMADYRERLNGRT